MFEFTPAHEQVTVGQSQVIKDWTLECRASTELPTEPLRRRNPDEAAGNFEAALAAAEVVALAAGEVLQLLAGHHKPPIRERTVRAAPEAQTAAAGTTPEPTVEANTQTIIDATDADDSFLVTGSTSGGLGASSDDEARRQRQFGGPKWRTSRSGLCRRQWTARPQYPWPAARHDDEHSLGLGRFRRQPINGGFGVGPAAGGPVTAV